MERQNFEESLKKTFDKAEVTPSEGVWKDIELDLERLEQGDMKKRITFYKFLAAASVIFALAVVGTGAYLLTGSGGDNPQIIAEQRPIPDASGATSPQPNAVAPGARIDTPAKDERTASVRGRAVQPSAPEGAREVSEDGSGVSRQPEHAANTTTDRSVAAANTTGRTSGPATDDIPPSGEHGPSENATSEAMATLSTTTGNLDSQKPVRAIAFSDRSLPPLVKQKKIVPHFPKTEPDQIDLLLASIEMEERASREKKSFDGEKIWTSVGFSAGTFNNHTPGATAPAMNTLASVSLTSASNTIVNEAAASGVSYSIGVNVGGKIAPRWVLQGGLNYMTQNAAFTSDAVVTQDNRSFKAAYSAEITKMADASARVVPTAPYSVSNTMEYLSIPLQAGYLVVNRSFGVQLNGGISTDLFIQNTLEPRSGSLDKVTNGVGSDSPYRPINFSGLVGTEISYRFSENYRISVNPGIRYPFNSIYKSDVGLEVTPLTFDVGLRFKYIFQ